ncbi:aminomethyltransferase [Actinopolymorpha cephalotaxi]|uniref:aminomethyltransferase n=1 Tax=Actinopolymorpha cephalotaxi TaxID=504797 RepID=A0A1I2QUN6_9ACTN|nr:glycine cleavage system aminomethyltransferase GcvT [Actinopolymorpha cephalotaxi]NYH82560.1 aminomethyltransferase [Actinopolymorpha cephalotaxi]SFG29977.1 aminomethyltransferase [Actinopolymorpha cephalotaxi]
MKRSPLHDRHQALGAKFAEFGGWEMPLEYAGGGVLREHAAVRSGAGVFDVSHLGKARVSGPGAADYVDSTLSNSLARIEPGKAQYTLCCDDATGGVVDDLIAYLRGPDEVFLVPNAANCAEVVRRLAAQAPDGVEVVDLHEEFVVLAVQGPRSDDVLAAAGLPTGHGYMSFVQADWQGAPVTVCRTGYTGERGYELVAPAHAGTALWDAILAAGQAYDIAACGLGARDTLRTEMGYPLHGQDISLDITPVQARLGWAVGWKKPAFWGRSVLSAERAAGPSRRLLGLEAAGRGIPRPGMSVVDADGSPVGVVTSGTFSPTRRVGVGLALLDAGVSEGSEVAVDVRGRREAFTVRRPPFVEASPTS